MRITMVLPLAAALALTACGSGEEDAAADGATSAADAADAMANAPQPRPGQYRSTSELIEFNVPGLSDDMKNMLQSAFAEGAAEPTTYCLTEEDAATSREDMIKNMAESDCTVNRFDVSGDTIDAALSCPTGEGANGDVTMHGTMAEDGANMEMSFNTEVPQMGTATIRMRVVTERIGDCS